MSFLRFYDGATPGKKRKHDSQLQYEKKKASWKAYEEKRVERKLNEAWKEGRSWLHFTDTDEMTCTICIAETDPANYPNLKNQNKFISGCSNKRISTVIEHENSKAHKRAVERQNLKSKTPEEISHSESGRALLALKSVDRNRLSILFKNVHAVAKHHRPFSDYVWMCEVDKTKGLDIGHTYINEKSALSFTKAIADLERNKTLSILNKAPFFSFIMDGSTDISGDEQESIYVRSSNRGEITERFLCLGTPNSTCSKDLFTFLNGVFESHGIDKAKLIGMGSDGAANMVGVKSGLAALLRDVGHDLLNIHCLCHRLELSFRDTFKKCRQYEKLMTLLIGLHYFYKKSYNNKKGLLNAFKALEIKGILPPRLTGTRWLPHLSNAITSLIRNFCAYEAHLSTLSHSNPKAEGLLKIMLEKDMMAFVLFLQILIEPLMKLSLKLQRSSITLADSMLWIRSTADLVAELKPGECKDLSDLLDSGMFKGICLKGPKPPMHYIDVIVSGAANAIQSRFLNDPNHLIHSTKILSLKDWPINDDSFRDFGDDEIRKVCEHFNNHLLSANKDYSLQETLLEWKLLKKVFKNRYGDNLTSMKWCQFMDDSDDFKNILNVVDLLLSLPPTSVSCETSFSHMKLVKTSRRSSLTSSTLNSLLTVKLVSPDIADFNAEEVVDFWLTSSVGQRRVHYQRTVTPKPQSLTSGTEDDGLCAELGESQEDDNDIQFINSIYSETESCEEMLNEKNILDFSNANSKESQE